MPGGKHALFNFLIGIINSWPPSVPKKRYAHTLNECVAGPYMGGLIYPPETKLDLANIPHSSLVCQKDVALVFGIFSS